ncbi:MAG: FAD-dependent oxidoreductase [Alphaproteobacteria bacterium]|nr:FAD-dependent oxidoreductase [Alphaproteobacteria bacterium]
MQAQARVVVIGGGCVGAAILYGLTRRGWRDVVLLERTQLTAGSTWHAAGLLPIYARSHAIGRMLAKSVEIYSGLEAETGQPVGFHRCGQLRVANTRARLDEFMSYAGVAEANGVEARIVTPSEIREIWPLFTGSDKMMGGLYHPTDGHIAPADVTQALVKGARDRGAEVYLNTEVTGFDSMPSGDWKVRTTQGDIVCEHIVTATGNYARQTAVLLGLDLPCIPILHQYWVTETVPELRERHAKGLPEMPILRDEDIAGYVREEGDALLFGPYERTEHLKLFAVDGVPKSFGADLLPEDFEAVEDNWAAATAYIPALSRAGIRRNVRGPFQMTSDEMPLAGPAWGLRNVWLAEGVPGGILWGGTLGYHLSEWIVEGGTGIDMSEIDPRRFGAYANKAWTKIKVQESWGTHPDMKFPGEDLPGARPAKTAPSYDRLTALGAVWGVSGGWEVPNWFAPPGVAAVDDYSYRASKHGAHVAAEVAAVRSGLGLMETSPMAKFEVSGPGAAAWLDRLLANHLPSVGGVRLAHHLTPRGTVQAEYVVARLAENRFYLVGEPRAERLYADLLSRALPGDGSVHLANTTLERGILSLAGPKSREVLQELTELDLGSAAFPWLSLGSATVGLASDVRLLRVSGTGELAFELHHPICYQRHLLEALLRAGGAYGLRLVGLHALDSLRLDKSYRVMFRDLNPEFTPLESGLDRFVGFGKGDFAGREALERQRRDGLTRRLVTLRIASGEGGVIGNEGVYAEGRLIGRIASGGYSHHLGCDLALAYLEADRCEAGTAMEVPVLGERRPGAVIADSPYDPESRRCRM